MTQRTDTLPSPEEPRLLTADELAAALHVSRAWVYEASRQGKIPTYRLGAVKRFDLAEVKAALRAPAPASARIVGFPR